MEAFSIEVTPRQQTGSPASRRLRLAEFIPAVVYHSGETSESVVVSRKEFTRLASVARKSQVFTLKSNLEKLNDRLAVVKEVQIDHLSRRPLHIDFQALKEDEEITIRVPLKFVGEAPGVKQDGGILNTMMHDVGVTCLPRAIPTELEVSIATLKVGDSIHARELQLPEGVRLDDAEDETIASVVAPAAAQEAAATATPDAAAGAATAAPAADAAAKAPEKK